jgi:polysaccharide export outer membrane protein
MNRFLVFLVVLIFLAISMSSCVSLKNVIYLNNVSDSTGNLTNPKIDFETPIQKNDLLSISIGGSNPEDVVTLNSGSGVIPGANVGGAASKNLGYLVEADGTIQLPFVGKVAVAGLTRLQLQDSLTLKLKDYTKNPVVNVKFLNYNYSVLGEVNHPGKFEMQNERTTIFDALASANDMTTFGKRQNILVVREENGQRHYGRVDILSKDVFKSQYYYLKTNDVVYVEPVKAKFITRNGIPQLIAIAAAAAALVLAILSFSK